MEQDETVIRWAVWYTDGTTLSGSTFDQWQALPEVGVQVVIVWFDDTNRGLETGFDHYFMTPDMICDSTDDSVDAILEQHPGASVKRGEWTTDEEYELLCREAIKA